jgi:hypothetical protein
MNGNASQQIVNKAWSFAHVLRDDEQTKLPGRRPSAIPKGKKGERYDWAALLEEVLETMRGRAPRN